jgi:hypothetical protein
MNPEQEFINEIDCRFPYDDDEAWKSLVNRGVAISPNAAFMVLHEICRPPVSGRPSPARLKQMFNYWRQRFHHPAVEIAEVAATALIDGQELQIDDAIDQIQAIERFPDASIALDIFLFVTDDIEGRVQDAVDSVRRKWQSPAMPS